MQGEKVFHYVAHARNPKNPEEEYGHYSGIAIMGKDFLSQTSTPQEIQEDYARLKDVIHTEMELACIRKYGKSESWLTVGSIQIVSLTRVD